jgi:flavin reductase (DIM6/NTAB) family NADH-FMN oxidoreductase RutF
VLRSEFVVNIISDWFIEAANYTSGDFDRGVDEMALAGLTPVPSVMVGPPRVAESAIQFECKLRQVVEFNDPRWEG